MLLLTKMALLAAITCMGANLQTDIDSQSQGKVQIPADESEYIKRLMENPNDQEMWGAELKRQQGLETVLEQRRRSDGDSPILKLAFANNYQLQGISYRHLRRYEEALGQLSRSQNVLLNLKSEHHCSDQRPSQICQDIQGQFSLLYKYF